MRALVPLAIVLLAGAAAAHPLGNFTTNRQLRVEIAPGTARFRYVVDLAELPAFRALAAMDANGDGDAGPDERTAWARMLAADVGARLHATIDAAPLALGPGDASVAVLPGAAGLRTLRAEITFTAALDATRATLGVRDDNFAGLPGWQEILAIATPGTTLAATGAATVDRTDGLRHYPETALDLPPTIREARITYAPGTASATETPATIPTGERFGDRLTALLADRRPLSTALVVTGLLMAAVVGAFHALTPGHGKTIVGAYLVGTRGTWRHAVFLGLVVTATHTLGVYALGAVTLVASAWILPERLLPWLSVASGLLVVGVGASLLRERLAGARHAHAHAHAHGHAHGHGPHGHDHEPHHHHHGPPVDAAPTLRNLVALGISGGLAPCPSALVVMLGAIAAGRTAFGLALIAAFSTGLALVLTVIGLVLVRARGLFDRLPLDGRIARFLPVASAAIISLAGLALLVEALVRIGA